MKIYQIEPIGISPEEIKSTLLEHDITSINSRGWSDDELINQTKDADILMLTNRPISAKVLNSLTSLKLISVAFSGIDHIDQETAKKRNILIKNTVGYANTAVAELALGLMISLARKIPQNNHNTRHGSPTNTGSELKGKTVGIVGYGAIGQEVQKIAAALGMNTLVFQRNGNITLEQLFTDSDYITLHIPLSSETRNMIAYSLLAKMKPTAFLINCARGPIVNSNDLFAILTENKIAGAALDVFDIEPPLPESYPLLQLENVIATPHIGFNTKEAQISKGTMAVNNIIQFLSQYKSSNK